MALIFPYMPGLSYPVGRSVGQWDTTIQVSVSGKETRFANRTQARYKYSLSVEGLDSLGTNTSLIAFSRQILDAFFNSTLGGALVFFFWDTEDNTVFGAEFGTGDSLTTQFQLLRDNQGSVDYIFAPIISGGTVYPQPGNTGLTAQFSAVEIFNNGTLVSSSAYTISSSGLVTFSSPPAGGAVLTWTGSYFWPCNFDDDTLQASKFMMGLWEAKSIKFTTRIY